MPLGDWVLREACRQNKAWQDAGMAPITVSVNVSARQFREKSWVGRVAQALSDTGLAPEYLELELTESLLMHDVGQAIATMRELQSIGVHFSIDDFGTGYSSLSALKSFPVARLKIDQSFVKNLPHDATTARSRPRSSRSARSCTCASLPRASRPRRRWNSCAPTTATSSRATTSAARSRRMRSRR